MHHRRAAFGAVEVYRVGGADRNPEVAQLSIGSARRYLETGETSALGSRIEVTAMHADGREFPVELGLTRVQRPGPPLFTAYLRDITERKLAHERLVDLFENARDLISTADNDNPLRR